ncbi:RNase HII [Paucidesulfovibrio gracilis DSM 16080]|uniref:Ribonuclease HII n=1 Tax=Paucidesulfovibrio gracilis DSM 16080 TaxID=1121449 RepID=A0A1T4XLL3_9BACT|nr:ribonuclease HII [Paucidesulfovibrio gracilis]SKA90450.1 RNase HII [Paucidesulfovibrio gracilis DSM 16080]
MNALLYDSLPLEVVAGVDEAGRGCLAGPVVAGAAMLPDSADLPGLTDSKALSEKKREVLYPLVRREALAFGIGLAWPWEIDELNILQATFLAMARAVAAMRRPARLLLVDGNKTIPGHALAAAGLDPLPQRFEIKGDARFPNISAASVLAKVWRDRFMVAMDRRYPGYGFAEHKGYGAKPHFQAIQELGPCRMHRRTFRGVRAEPEPQRQFGLPGL